ncbi:MAG TPA: sel1 repeat family protein [Deltaproteobacteria bacterium]|nr:sel1 repeat family protein [Deltaproteobacteria bacterium]HIJ75479.1 sel1 repeat family protein [Deltaproteobacteria bacterium]
MALLIGFAALAHAGFDEGKAAFGRGDYAKAYEEFKKLAVRGHVKAQGCLGEMYHSGKGVPQDYAEAVKWFRKAAGPA